jgi:invasin-like protein
MQAAMASFLLVFVLAYGCTAPVDNIVGPSSSGFTVGISALYGSGGLKNDGSSQATIRVEVFTNSQPVDGATVTLTTTLGTLGSNSLTTANGAATTTLTSSTTTGLAYIVATVENVSATTAVPIVSF